VLPPSAIELRAADGRLLTANDTTVIPPVATKKTPTQSKRRERA
jgi:hypothetical protein